MTKMDRGRNIEISDALYSTLHGLSSTVDGYFSACGRQYKLIYRGKTEMFGGTSAVAAINLARNGNGDDAQGVIPTFIRLANEVGIVTQESADKTHLILQRESLTVQNLKAFDGKLREEISRLQQAAQTESGARKTLATDLGRQFQGMTSGLPRKEMLELLGIFTDAALPRPVAQSMKPHISRMMEAENKR
jgi:hypothetical protein